MIRKVRRMTVIGSKKIDLSHLWPPLWPFRLVFPLLAVCFVLSSPHAAGAVSEPVQLLAGSAIREITPSPGSPMSGYGDRGNRPSQGVHDRLYCRSLILEGTGLRIALVSADMLAFTPDLRTAIVESIRDLNIDLLFLAATHTHSGPGGYQEGWAIGRFLMGTYSKDLFCFLAREITACVRDAQKGLVPANVAYGQGSAPDLCRNRRHEGGLTDPQVGVLRVEGLDGKTLGIVVSFGAHPTVLSPRNLLYSGDYAGMTARSLEGSAGAPVLFFNGAIGDQKPHYPGTKEWEASLTEQFEEAERMAATLTNEVLRVAGEIKPEPLSILRANERAVDLPRVKLRDRCFYYVFTPILRLVFNNIFHDQTLFQAVRINDLLLVGLPAEVSAELVMNIKRATPVRTAMVACQVNDTLGYVLSPADYALGGYEACMSFYGKEFGTFFVDQALATAHALTF